MKNVHLIILLITSCQDAGKFDLFKVNDETEISKTLNKLNISNVHTQNGYWNLVEKEGKIEANLQNNGSVSTIYSLRSEQEESLFNFDNFKIEKNTGGKIVEHANKLAFVNISLENADTFNVLKKLKEDLGNPDQIINDSVFYNVEDKKVKLVLKVFDKNDIHTEKDEFEDEYLIYPLHFVWNINGYIYKYTLFINETSFSNDLVMIADKAFNERLIFGYHNPKEDPIFKKYCRLPQESISNE